MSKRNHPNFLDFTPTREVKTLRDDDGSLVLLTPKFGVGLLGRWMSSLVGSRSILKVHLDPLGTHTWDAIDGRRTVGEIADVVSKRTGEDAASLYERCSKFIKTLADAGAVRLEPPPGG